MSFSLVGNLVTQAVSTTDTNVSGMSGNGTSAYIASSNDPAVSKRNAFFSDKGLFIDGIMTLLPETDSITFEGNPGAVPTIEISSTGRLNIGQETTVLNKVSRSVHTAITDTQYSTSANEAWGKAQTYYSFMKRDKAGILVVRGATINTARCFNFDTAPDRNDLETGYYDVESLVLGKPNSDYREARIHKFKPGNISPSSRIVGLELHGGFTFSHRALPREVQVTLIDGVIAQLSGGQLIADFNKLDVSNNQYDSDFYYDSNDSRGVDGVGVSSTAAKTYNIYGSATGSAIRSTVKPSAQATVDRRRGRTITYAPFVMNLTDVSGAIVTSGAVFIRDTDNGNRKNKNGFDNTDDNTYYEAINSGTTARIDVVTGITNRETEAEYDPFLLANTLDYRGNNYAISDMSITNASSSNADIGSAGGLLPTINQGDWFQLSGMTTATNNEVWQAQSDGTSTSVNASLITGIAGNEAANAGTIAVYGDDRYDIIIRTKECILSVRADTQLRGMYDRDGPQQLNAVMIKDTNWSGSNSGLPLSLSVFANLNELYDAGKEWNILETNVMYPTKNNQIIEADGNTLNFGSVNLIIDGTAGSLFSLDTDTLTIKALALASTSKFNKITTTGTITFQNGADMDGNYTDSSGTYVLITAPFLVSGTRWQLKDIVGDILLHDEVLSSDGGSYRYAHTSDKTIEMKAGYQNGATALKFIRTATVVDNSGHSFEDVQVANTTYDDYGKDGSTVTGITAVGPTYSFNMNDADGQLEIGDMYAFIQYWITTSQGMQDYRDYMDGTTDTENYAIRSPMKTKNINAAKPLYFIGASIVGEGGYNFIDETGYSIFASSARAYRPPTDTVTSENVAAIAAQQALNTATLDGVASNVSTMPQDVRSEMDDSSTKLSRLDVPVSSIDGMTEVELHDGLDNYQNKGVWKTDIEPVTSAVDSIAVQQSVDSAVLGKVLALEEADEVVNYDAGTVVKKTTGTGTVILDKVIVISGPKPTGSVSVLKP